MDSGSNELHSHFGIIKNKHKMFFSLGTNNDAGLAKA
jgi:hypothetical protein